jgi:hypothetical protein
MSTEARYHHHHHRTMSVPRALRARAAYHGGTGNEPVAVRLPPATAAAAVGSLPSEAKRKAESEQEYAARLATERARLERQVAATGRPLERNRVRRAALVDKTRELEDAIARAEARLVRDRARLAALDAERLAAASARLEREAREAADAAGAVAALVVDPAAAARDAEAALAAARKAAEPRLYRSGTGRYQALYDHLWKKLVPRSGPADTRAGNLMIGLTKLGYWLNNDGVPPRQSWDDNPEYFRELGIRWYDELYLADAPASLTNYRAFTHWIELVLRRILREGVPAKALPLPAGTPRADVDDDWR